MQIKISHLQITKLLSIVLSFISIIIIVHKIDQFDTLHILPSLKILYVSFFTILAGSFFFFYKNKNIFQFFFSSILSFILFFITVNFTTTQLHWIFSAMIGFYCIAFGAIYIYKYHKKYQLQHPTKEKKCHHTHKAIFITISIATAIHLFFGLSDIGKASYVDERLWIYDRIEQYWDNVLERDWKNTRPSDKPGVTTAIVTGPGLLFFDPTAFAKGTIQKEQIASLFTALRTPQFLIITLLSLCVFPLVRRLLDTHVAVYTTILLLLSPLLLGISRIINPDALLWIILFLCFISFLLYLREHTLQWIYLTGILLGLALLTKYIANIFFVFFFLLLFVDSIIHKKLPHNLNTHIKDKLIHYTIMTFTALSVFYVLYPGVWVKHDRLLIATIYSEAFSSTWIYFFCVIILILIDTFLFKNFVLTKIITTCQKYKNILVYTIISIFTISALITICNVYTQMPFFDFSRIIESPKSIYKEVSDLAIYFTSFFPLLFGVTPLVFIFAFFSYYTIFAHKKLSQKTIIITYCTLFILVYYFASTINNVVPIVRYQIILYPFFILIASIGINMLTRIFSKKQYIFYITSIVIICLSSWQLAHMSHFYFSYNSPLLPKQYVINTKDMGDGNYEIAQYLNNLSNAKDLLIWTDKRGVCQFFVGTCNNMIKDKELRYIAPNIDYYIISQNRKNYITHVTKNLTTKSSHNVHLDRLYSENIPSVYEIYPSKRHAHYIKIIDAKAINIIE
ncbi:MAG: hypothetical protein CR972_03280 [Candidatus Moraniibacteriota bacterium]|nr:MAG: hypothetical protein CR972_03280 [Candidatus Moranbacteria bacterium]